MAKDRLDQLLEAAKSHGDQSEPDMEVGDLQEILLTCWKTMTKQQKATVWEECSYLVDERL